MKVINYKNKWKAGSLNKPLWKEVLIGKKIVGIKWDENRMTSLKLDSGETLYFDLSSDYSISINVPEDK